MKSVTEITLFQPGESIAYKENELAAVSGFANKQTQFFIANPVRNLYAPKPGSLENIAAYRNIVVEFDGIDIKKQGSLVKKMEMPFAMATFSGNKSNHYIISVSDSFRSLEEYTYYARAIYFVMGGAPDPKCKNANRLTRLPGSTRADNGAEQSLIAMSSPITKSELEDWLIAQKRFQKFLREEAVEEEQRRLRQQRVSEVGPAPLPRIYLDMVNGGALHPDTNSRHDSLVKFGAWLVHNGYDEAALEDYLFRAADALGLGERNDARELTAYFARKVGSV
jgi:hypothetical protein